MVKGILGRIFRLEDYKPQQAQKTIHIQQIGSTGTESYSGYNYEEYLANLHGRERAKVFDKMRRSDAQVKMLLSAFKSPIMSANWDIHPFDQNDPESVKDAELINHILMNDMDKPFKEFLKEALTVVDFGHSVFEIIDKVGSIPNFGSYNGIAALAFRSQKTIERWNLDTRTDKLLSVTQYAYGDLDRMVDIPAEFLMVFSLDKEGSNYEGISALRPCYGNWYRKNEYLKLNAIGIEKFAVPTPLVKVPAGKENGEQFANMTAALEAYLTHEKNYLTYPDGWEIDLKTNTYDPQKVEVSIDNEDKRMAKSFVLNFLELGMNGFGSQSLSFDLSDFFLNSLDHVAELISGQINRVLIPRLIKMNRGERAGYPTLCHSGISDQGGKEMSESLKLLIESKVIQPDDALEAFIRKKYKLPDPSDQGRREVQQQYPSSIPKMMERVRALRLTRGE